MVLCPDDQKLISRHDRIRAEKQEAFRLRAVDRIISAEAGCIFRPHLSDSRLFREFPCDLLRRDIRIILRPDEDCHEDGKSQSGKDYHYS